MRVKHKISQIIFRVVLNHFDSYEFVNSKTRHSKDDYDVLPEEEKDPLNGLTEAEYIDIYGNLP